MNSRSIRFPLNRNPIAGSPEKPGWFFLSLLLMVFLSLTVKAQETSTLSLSLEDAVSTALNRHPDIRNAALQIEKAVTMKSGAWEFNPIEFTYRAGQINSGENDRYIKLNQNFGSLLTHIQRYKLAKEIMNVKLSEFEITKRSLVAQVKSAYYFWWYMYEKYTLVQEESKLYDDMQRIADLRYQLGETGELERTAASARAAGIQNQLGILADEIMIAANKLQELMFTEGNFIPPDLEFSMYRIDKPSDTSSYRNAIITDYYRNTVTVNEVLAKKERSRFFPELFAGYLNQEIGPLKGLQGWQVGLSFPLLAFGQVSRVKQAEIDTEIASNQLEYMAFSADRSIENLVAELTRNFRQLTYYNEFGLKQADEIVRNAQIQFEKENIEYPAFVENTSLGLSIKKEYLETLNKYNQTAIQLEFYAY